MTVYSFLIFILMLGSTGLLLAVVLALLMARAILSPPRMTDGKAVYRLQRLSPGDLGLHFENLGFTVRDAAGRSLKIAGWWMPAASVSQRCVVLIHGYADAKVGAIAWASLLHQAGCNILAIDLRAHGESGGKFCTGGYFERDDINQVIDQLLTHRTRETGELILLGISLGAAVAAAVAAGRGDVAAVILDSPFADYRRVITAHTALLGMPRGPILQAAIACAQWISRAKFDDVRPVDTIARIRCPVLAIVGADDELLDPRDIQALRSVVETQSHSRFWLVEGASHLMALHTHPLEYRQRLEDVLATTIPMIPNPR
jgi:pimeloyl-ACP methyl ester carboxylesterase